MGAIKRALSGAAARFRFSKTAVPTRTKLALALPAPASSLSQVFVSNIFVKCYTDAIGVDPVTVGAIYWWMGLWAAINNVAIGWIMDRIRYDPRKGKYLRVMRRAAPVMVACLAAVSLARPSWPEVVSAATAAAAGTAAVAAMPG